MSKIVATSRVYVPPARSHFPKAWEEAGITQGPDGTVRHVRDGSACVDWDDGTTTDSILVTNLRLVTQRPMFGPNRPQPEEA